MGDDLQAQAAEAPPPPGTNRIEITVGGHSVTIESTEPLADVIGYALNVYEQTQGPARNIPLGFDTTGGQFERAEPYLEPSGMQSWEDEHARRLDRKPTEVATTRRLEFPDPAGHHRSRLGPVQMDRGRAPVPRAGH